jgi:hypothetical protein
MLQCQVAVWDPQPAACRLQGGELIYTLETLQQPWCCGVCGSAGSKLVSCSFKPKASVAGVHDSLGRVLCCAVLCCAVLCCAVLCCAVLCCAVLCCAVLCCAARLCCRLVCATQTSASVVASGPSRATWWLLTMSEWHWLHNQYTMTNVE